MADDDNKAWRPFLDKEGEFDPPVLDKHTLSRWVVGNEPLPEEVEHIEEIPIRTYALPQPENIRGVEDLIIDLILEVRTTTTLKVFSIIGILFGVISTIALIYLWSNNLSCMP